MELVHHVKLGGVGTGDGHLNRALLLAKGHSKPKENNLHMDTREEGVARQPFWSLENKRKKKPFVVGTPC